MTTGPGNPSPRPALRKASDSAVHPVAPEQAGAAAKPAKGTKAAKEAKAERSSKTEGSDVEVVVTMPKALRKRLKVAAGEHGYTPEQAMVQLVRMWLDG